MTASYKIYWMGFRVFTLLALVLSAFGPWQTTQVFADKLVCGIPGKEGPVTLVNGVVNTYYPGVGSASINDTSISVGSASGAAQTIQAGDLLLVIQMQGAEIDSSNTGAYGNGVAGDPATGNLTSPASNFTAGQYEYVVATNAVGAGGGSVSISSGLANNYSTQNYPVGAGNQGQRRFQVIRVPQYSSATITATVTALSWNGSVGGVVALDVAGELTFSGGSINVNGQGFRGGGAVSADGGGGATNTDYRLPSSVPANSSKGEGIAGTPRYVFNGTTIIDFGALLEGYPNGTLGRGAPGNAGGGGTDGNQVQNDENTGGGGGGNGGTGGKGGFSWDSVIDSGGFGGSAFTAVSPARLVLGGGGGAGTINDNDPILSSGGVGGGIVMVRAGTVTGNGSINANGLDGQDQPLFDSGGGAGAGGSVLVLAKNGALPATLNVNANGGNGGDAWLTQPPPGTTYPGERHGPGGGGGGGVIYLSSAAGTLSANGGTNGLTTTANDNYGSGPGSVGIINTGVTPTQTTTGISGAECIPDPSVVKTTSTPIVAQTATGTSGTYKIVVSVPEDQGTALGFSISDTLPAGFSYASTTSITPSAGATYTPNVAPSLGDTVPVWGTFDIPGGEQVEINFTVNIAASVLPGTYQNPATAEYTDPTRTVPTGTTSRNYDPADPGEDITVTANSGPALTIVKSVTETSYTTVGTVLHYSYLVTNTGNVTLNAPFTVTDDKSTDEACPATATLAPGASITCTATYTVTQADINAGSVTNTASAHGLFGTVPVNSPTDTETVNSVAADLSLSKTVNNSAPLIGAAVTFTVTVTNIGPDPTTGVQVGDLLPAGFTFVSATPSTGIYTSGTGVWNIGALAVNGSATLTITATVNPSGPYVNSAQITASNQVDPNSIPNNNDPDEDDQDSVTITPAQGAVTKNVDITSARIGEIVTYEVSAVIPSGTFDNVTLVDTMDRGLSFIACDSITAGSMTTTVTDPDNILTPFNYICANPTVDSNGSADPVDVGRRVTFNFGTLTNAPATDQILTVTYRAVVLDSLENQNDVDVLNSAQVSWTGSNNPPVSSTVEIVEPDLSISKTSNNTFIANGTTVTFFITIQHTAASTVNAYDVVVTDVLPSTLDFVTGSLDCTLGAQDPAPCTYDTVTRTISATWNTFVLAGGTGRISFQVTGNANLPANGSVTNVGSVAWTSLPGNFSEPQSQNQFSTERYYDPDDPNQINVFGASASLDLSPLGGGGDEDEEGRGERNGGNARDVQGSGGFLIPITGFAPGVVTDLSGLPVSRYDADLGLSLEIPRLKLNMPIVGAPLKNGTWDVNWLTNQAGWLEKTAFPGFPGNSVLTGHVTSAYGVAGPFAGLHKLQEGDLIFVHTFGQTQIYKVQTVKKVQPNDISVLDHQEKPWLTLLTCADFNEKTSKYLSRVVVRAELLEVRNGDINGP